MAKKKIKRESWLVFYRNKSGKLDNHEIPMKSVMRQATDPDVEREFEVTKEEAMHLVSQRKSFDKFELDSHGEPIVMRMQYV